MISALVRCPNCKQEYDGDEDKPIFKLQYCEDYVCVMCAKEHMKSCKTYWRKCYKALTRKLEWGML